MNRYNRIFNGVLQESSDNVNWTDIDTGDKVYSRLFFVRGTMFALLNNNLVITDFINDRIVKEQGGDCLVFEIEKPNFDKIYIANGLECQDLDTGNIKTFPSKIRTIKANPYNDSDTNLYVWLENGALYQIDYTLVELTLLYANNAGDPFFDNENNLYYFNGTNVYKNGVFHCSYYRTGTVFKTLNNGNYVYCLSARLISGRFHTLSFRIQTTTTSEENDPVTVDINDFGSENSIDYYALASTYLNLYTDSFNDNNIIYNYKTNSFLINTNSFTTTIDLSSFYSIAYNKIFLERNIDHYSVQQNFPNITDYNNFYVLTINANTNYSIENIESEIGTVSENIINYDGLHYVHDTILVTTIFNVAVEPGWFSFPELVNKTYLVNGNTFNKNTGEAYDVYKITFDNDGHLTFNDNINNDDYIDYFELISNLTVESAAVQFAFNSKRTAQIISGSVNITQLDSGVENITYEETIVNEPNVFIFERTKTKIIFDFVPIYWVYKNIDTNNGFVTVPYNSKAEILLTGAEPNIDITVESQSASMNINFYNNLSENNKVEKNIELLFSANGRLKSETSLISPVVIIELKDYFRANYCYIPLFDRFYYITDIKSISYSLWEITLKNDPLYSFASQIRNQYGLISRNEYEYDEMLDDKQAYIKYNNTVEEYVPEWHQGSEYHLTNLMPVLIGTSIQNTIVKFIGALNPGGIEPTPGGDIISPNNVLPTITHLDMLYDDSKITVVTGGTNLANFKNAINETNVSFISNIIIYPFEIPIKDSTTYNVYLGNSTTPLENITVLLPKTSISDYVYIADFTITGDNFKDYEPYCLYEMYLPYHGWINVKASNILNKRLIVGYICDWESALSSVFVIDVTTNRLVYMGPANLGFSIGITTDNSYTIGQQRLLNNISMALGTAGSLTKVAAGGFAGNANAMISGTNSIVNTIAGGMIKNNLMYETANAAVNSSQLGLETPQDVRIRKTKTNFYEIEDYNKLYGKPLNDYRKLGNLHGYTEVDKIHLENMGTATKTEIDEIESLLLKGVIL